MLNDPELQRRVDRGRQNVSIAQLWRYFKFPFADNGEDQKVRCPFHDDFTPSSKLFLSQNSFHCWVCGEGGDVMWVARKVLGLQFKVVLSWLEKTFLTEEEDYVARFAAAQQKLQTEQPPLDLEAYWDTRHEQLVALMAEHVDGPYRLAWLGMLDYIYDQLDDLLTDIRLGTVGSLDEVGRVFDWAYAMTRVYEVRLVDAA